MNVAHFALGDVLTSLIGLQLEPRSGFFCGRHAPHHDPTTWFPRGSCFVLIEFVPADEHILVLAPDGTVGKAYAVRFERR